MPDGAASAFRNNGLAVGSESAGIPACELAETFEAVVQVYGARALGWRGYFGVHTWTAVKPSGARDFTVYEVTFLGLLRRGSAVTSRKRAPDAPWFGNAAELLAEKRGDGVSAMIQCIDKAACEYRYARKYFLWPGPNSNTFTAHLGRTVPDLELDLPPTAIGKDYLGPRMVAVAPSGSGIQFSLFGLLGVIVSRVEGFEVNILGLTFGIDPFTIALKLPFIGRLGAARSRDPSAQERMATEPS
jgi:Protein of unknown function (DUF3750)